jgi:hypothetical protein
MPTLNEKLDEIAELLARDLGFGPLSTLDATTCEEIRAEGVDATEAWSEAEVESIEPLEAKTDLQRLLGQYRDIEEAILDARDADLSDDGS